MLKKGPLAGKRDCNRKGSQGERASCGILDNKPMPYDQIRQ
jgi:hypothetical protein